jgi:hypothetical protein
LSFGRSTTLRRAEIVMIIRRKRTNLGWAIQGACLLLLAAGLLAEQADWVRFESSWVYPALLAVMGAAWVLEGMINRRPSKVKEAEQGAGPNSGPSKFLEDSKTIDGGHR